MGRKTFPKIGNRKSARDMLKEYLELYLSEKGINIRKPFHCLNPEHEDHNPSMSFDKRRNKVKCFSCNASYDIIDLIQLDYMCSVKEAFEIGYRRYGISYEDDVPATKSSFKGKGKIIKDDFTAYLSECSQRLEETDYLTVKRGISRETLARFKVGYDEHFSYGTGGIEWNAVIFPTGVFGKSFTARSTDSNADQKDRLRKRGNAALFNPSALLEDSPIFIVEGEIDALSVIDIGASAVGLGGTSNTDVLLRYISENHISPKYPLLLALDNDDAGRKATAQLLELLSESGVMAKAVDILGEYKDPNEALISDRDAFMSVVLEKVRDETEEELRKIEYCSAESVYAEFLKDAALRRSGGMILTGYRRLDKALRGGLASGLYAVGAVPSLGKTAFCLQMADQIASQGHDVLYFSLEMSRFELIARSISRETFQRAYGNDAERKVLARPTNSILEGGVYDEESGVYRAFSVAQQSHIHACSEAYLQYAHHLFFFEHTVGEEGRGMGVSGVENTVSWFIRHKKSRPVVFVDYLQLLLSEDDSRTDKQNIDNAILKLKDVARLHRIPVVVISSFNRANYKNAVAMESFKESGGIEYTADVLIGLQYEGVGRGGISIKDAMNKRPRKIEAVILKNRNGAAGQSVSFQFFSGNNTFLDDD